MNRRLSTVVLAIAGLLVASFGAATSPAAAAPSEQWRGYWVDAFNEGVYNPDQVSDLVQDAQDLHANALIVQIVRRYDCFCNRALYPRTEAGIDPAPYDPLDEVIAQAHAAGLEVHAWVNVNTMWNLANPPAAPDHVFNTHGPGAEGADRWLNKRADGVELVGNNAFIDPANPAAGSYIVDGIRSIVDEYDVDGINLDYIRYPDYNSSTGQSDWGYSEVSLARFQAATGRDDVPEPDDAEFSDWRRQQLTNLVRKIYLGMWESDPQARLSMDAVTYAYGPQSMGGWEQTRPYAEVLQDWKGWQDGGFMDTVVAMNYKRNWLDNQAQMFSEWTEVLADWQGDRQAVNGPALYLNSVSDSLEQAQEALAPTEAGNTAAGWSGYSYANPSNEYVGGPWKDRSAEREALVEALTTGADAPFAEPAAVPSMPWKEAPAEGHVTGQLTLSDGTALDGATVEITPLTGGGAESATVTDGAGWFGAAHLAPGHYLVRVDLPDDVVGQPVAPVRVRAGTVATAEFAPLVALP